MNYSMCGDCSTIGLILRTGLTLLFIGARFILFSCVACCEFYHIIEATLFWLIPLSNAV